jgi:hypothetical protein
VVNATGLEKQKRYRFLDGNASEPRVDEADLAQLAAIARSRREPACQFDLAGSCLRIGYIAILLM